MIRSMTLKNAERVGSDFLRIDSQVGLTFSGTALATDNEEKRRRTTAIARKAHDTITRLRPSIELTNAEESELDRNLLRLKRELQILGEIF